MADQELKLRPLPADTDIGRWVLGKPLYVLPHAIVYRARSSDGETPALVEEFMPAALAGREPGGVEVRPLSAEAEAALRPHRATFVGAVERMRALPLGKTLAVFDLIEANGTVYAVFERPPGPRLERLLEPGEGLSPGEVEELMPALLGSLRACHEADLPHLAMAPDAVFVGADGTLLLDRPSPFGPDAADGIGYRWPEGDAYAPPEGGDPVRDDIYGAAALLYRVVVGSPPPPPAKRAAAELAGEPDPVDAALDAEGGRWPAGTIEAIRRGLQLEPAARPGSIAAMIDIAAANTLQEVPTPARPGRERLSEAGGEDTKEPDTVPGGERASRDPDETPTVLVRRGAPDEESGTSDDPDAVPTKLIGRGDGSARQEPGPPDPDAEPTVLIGSDRKAGRPAAPSRARTVREQDETATVRMDAANAPEGDADSAQPPAAGDTVVYRRGKPTRGPSGAPAARPRPPQSEAVPPDFFLHAPAAQKPEPWRDVDLFLAEPGLRSSIQETLEGAAGGSGAPRDAPLLTIRPGAPVTIVAAAENGDIGPALVVVDWVESFQRLRFRVRPDAAEAMRLRFFAFVGPVAVARIDAALPEPAALVAAEGGLRSPFIAFDRDDAPVRAALEAAQSHLCLPFLDEQLSARGAGDWNADILRLIEKADLFQLCWTGAASASRAVRQEVDFFDALEPRPSYLAVSMGDVSTPLPVLSAAAGDAIAMQAPGIPRPAVGKTGAGI